MAPGATPGLPPPRPPLDIPPDKLPRFEVESVKKVEGRPTASNLRTPGGGRLMMTNLPLRTIVMQAFGGLREYEFSGGPGWMTTDRFSITAKAETNAPRDQLMLMLRAVLVDRFQMKFHVEKKEMQAYVLTVADPPWKPTPRMRVQECGPPPGAARGAAPTGTPGAAAPPPPPARIDQMCGGTMLSTNGITARGVPMANFVSLIGSLGGLGVVHDKTGLTGTYHIELDASPTALLRSMSVLSLSGVNPSGEPNLLPNVGEGRSLDSAVRDLGLKLTRQREMVDVLVIESLSQPDED
jgi:uncharacterized protein (TIGR03435 family)